MKKKIYLAIMLALSAPLVGAATEEKPRAVSRSASASEWAYQPVRSPEVPSVQHSKWVRSPIDAFVLAKLEEKGIKPSPEADRATYIRRATLDAWGLLPTPEEVKAFVNDRSPDAYEKLVDRLLSSHHFGERQARRWLDLARYADSSGFQNDQTRPNNWRYRDYVINAFNQDKPFDRFIKEQVAGDELFPGSQEALVATGLLAGYPDNANSRDLVQRKYQIETDVTDLVGETFLASTVGCARCHNHKADKVSQKEYFQLQAFFANTAFDDRVKVAAGAETQWDKPDPVISEQQAKYREATKAITDRQKELIEPFRDAGLKYYKERYLTDSRESIFKPKTDWNALDRWVNHRFETVSRNRDTLAANYLRRTAENPEFPEHDPANIEKWKEYEKLQAELREFDDLRPQRGAAVAGFVTAATELGSPEAPPTFVRFGGIHERPTEEVQPDVPKLWGGDPITITPLPNSSGRRSALANWLASPNNPLTARVYVNRVWSQLFDKGIVTTLADFGRAGQRPSHPELLDYLATSFVNNGWSVKKLQREILLSSVYRQSSAHRDDIVSADPENKLLAVFPRKRLEAEEIRDSLLYASGQLVDKVGGPAVFPPLAKALNVDRGDFEGNRAWVVSKDKEDWNRRSIYVFVRRSLPYPLLQNFDPANPSAPHHRRDVTTTPLQALTLFNSDLTFSWSQALAGRVINEAGESEAAQLGRLFEILFSRSPNKQEVALLKDFLAQGELAVREKIADGKFEVAVPTGLKNTKKLDPVRAAALVDLVHTVANSNDFAYRF